MKDLDVIACLLASIAVNVTLAVAWHRHTCRTSPRHYTVPSNVVRLDSRRKAGANVTVLRSAK